MTKNSLAEKTTIVILWDSITKALAERVHPDAYGRRFNELHNLIFEGGSSNTGFAYWEITKLGDKAFNAKAICSTTFYDIVWPTLTKNDTHIVFIKTPVS